MDKASRLANASLLLGIGSMVGLIMAIVLGFLVEDLGMVSLFRMVIPLAFAAVVFGVLARQKIAEEGLPGLGIANTGLYLGIVCLVIMGAIFLVVATLFLPMLFLN